jgi:hypothetical protein
MHAYAHEWACQLIFNPRLCEGLGLTDGEGVERLWSRLRKLIGIQRSSGVCSKLNIENLTIHHFCSVNGVSGYWTASLYQLEESCETILGTGSSVNTNKGYCSKARKRRRSLMSATTLLTNCASNGSCK